jgi:hypothetical protein
MRQCVPAGFKERIEEVWTSSNRFSDHPRPVDIAVARGLLLSGRHGSRSDESGCAPN